MKRGTGRLEAELYAALKSPGFWLAALGLGTVFLLGDMEDLILGLKSPGLLPYGYHRGLMAQGVTSKAMGMALPVLCAVPYSAALLEDFRTGFWRPCLSRSTEKEYLWGKIGTCWLMGTLAAFVGAALSWLFLALLLLPREAAPQGGAWEISDLVGRLLLLSGTGGLWAILGMTAALITKSRSVAYAAPFLCCYFLKILFQRYFPGAPILDPASWIDPPAGWPGDRWGAALLIAQLTALCTLWLWCLGKRRLREG